jgi:hypothetical protein
LDELTYLIPILGCTEIVGERAFKYPPRSNTLYKDMPHQDWGFDNTFGIVMSMENIRVTVRKIFRGGVFLLFIIFPI